MKKILTLFAVVGLMMFSSCEGPQGPPGIPGQDGFLAGVVEITNVSFTTTNEFTTLKVFSGPIYPTDMVLVYRLSSVDNNGTDIWSLLPETHYFPDGTLNFNYDFDFTQYDVNIFMTGNDLATVSDAYRINQVFRIVIIPADFINAIDKNNYNEVMSVLNLKESQVKKIEF
ncbi:MAG TPA: hypothetical protein VIV55_00815 [Flavobacterium sp.]